MTDNFTINLIAFNSYDNVMKRANLQLYRLSYKWFDLIQNVKRIMNDL